MGIAQISNGVVVAVDRTRDSPPDGWVVCGADVVCGMAFDGAEFSTFDARLYQSPGVLRPLADVKASRLAELAALRYARETGGVGGFRTDRESQALLTGAALAASLDAGYTVDWKGEGGWVTLNATQLLAAAQAVRAHVQACFSNERAHADAIAALTDPAAVVAHDLSTGWPT